LIFAVVLIGFRTARIIVIRMFMLHLLPPFMVPTLRVSLIYIFSVNIATSSSFRLANILLLLLLLFANCLVIAWRIIWLSANVYLIGALLPASTVVIAFPSRGGIHCAGAW